MESQTVVASEQVGKGNGNRSMGKSFKYLPVKGRSSWREMWGKGRFNF